MVRGKLGIIPQNNMIKNDPEGIPPIFEKARGNQQRPL